MTSHVNLSLDSRNVGPKHEMQTLNETLAFAFYDDGNWPLLILIMMIQVIRGLITNQEWENLK